MHAIPVVLPLSYLLGILTWPQLQAVLVVGTVGTLVLEYLRLSGRIDWFIYDHLTREYEQDDPGAYALYAIAVTLVALVFPVRAAIPAMVLLAIADPISGILSNRGTVGPKRGTVLAATFLVGVILAMLVNVPFWPAIAGGIATAVADGMKPTIMGYVLDDDFTIPIASATAIEVVWRLVG